MKKTLSLLLLLSIQAIFAQEAAEIRDFFWGASDPVKKITDVPDKWKNESAVIIYKNEFYDYHKFGTNVKYTSAIRKRVKLLDQAAVKEFSEFSFVEKFNSSKGYTSIWTYRRGETMVGIKIVKPDGKEVEIDVDKEAKKADQKKQIAIPNLEIGDIIDYYYYVIEPFKSNYQLGFDPIETPLGDVYPTMEFKLRFQTENDFFVNFNTYNGAPQLKEIPSGKGNERHYELTASNLAKNEFPRWFYPLAEMPCYKFQVFFARSGKFEAMADAFLSEKESVVKKEVTNDDIFKYYDSKFHPFGDLSPVNAFLKKNQFATDEEKVREVYYYTRHQFYTQYIEATVADKAKIFYPYELYRNPIFFNSEESFINYFMAFLKKSDIDYDIIVAMPRYRGPIKDLLIQKDVTVLLRVNTPTPIYLQYFSPFSSADQFSDEIENSDAYVLEVAKGKRVVNAQNVKLPSSTAKDNKSSNKLIAKLDDEMSGLKVNRVCSYTGHMKTQEQDSRLEFYDYVNEDYTKYANEPLLDRVGNKKKREQYKKEFDALINKLKAEKAEACKKELSEEFDFEIDEATRTITSNGRFGSQTPFVYDENFSVKNNLVKKAGPNMIVEVGKLLTSQVEIDKKEKERTNNIYMSFPRSFDNEIVLEIPQGYTATGLEKLNKKIDNETGSFISSATVEGNKLVIKTTKVYKNYYEPNKNWNKMIEFLDAAYQFTQEKVMLKKA